MMKPRITPDGQLATPEAIAFRIALISNSSEAMSPAAAKRIAALRLRLPSAAGKPLLPSVNPALLCSKSELDWGDRRKTA